MMKRVLAVAVILMLAHTVVWASAQQLDVVIYKGVAHEACPFPLESFFKEGAPRPRFRADPRFILSTDNHRGYIATWEVKDGFLYLIDLGAWLCNGFGPTETCKKVDLKEMFGKNYQSRRVKAEWFSGELRLADGMCSFWRGEGSIFERYIVMTVKSGMIMDEKVVNNGKTWPFNNVQLDGSQ